MISKELENILQDMYAKAQEAHHEMVGLEHLLLALVEGSGKVKNALQHCGAEIPLLTVQLQESIDENTPAVHLDNGRSEPQPTLGFQRVMQRAMIHAQHSSQSQVQPEDMLVTSGLDSVYPAGIPVAKVVQTGRNTGMPYYSAQLKPVAALRSSKYVLVLPQQPLPQTGETTSDAAAASVPSAKP